MQYWLMKSEPDAYSIDDLKREKVTSWSGVRNFQARNFMMQMAVGDLVLFYHSSTKPAGVAGVAKVAKKAHPDESQFDSKGEYFEPRATVEKPLWYCPNIRFVSKLKALFTLDEIKLDPKLEGMRARISTRLSVQPVSKKDFEYIVSIDGI